MNEWIFDISVNFKCIFRRAQLEKTGGFQTRGFQSTTFDESTQ